MEYSLPYPANRVISLPYPVRWGIALSRFVERAVRFADGNSPDRADSSFANHTDNIRLVERARQGDHGAFRQLFETYSPLVYRIIYRMVGSPDETADLTQDVFVRAYERLHTLKDGQAFYAWITRLAVNMAHDRLRKKRPESLSLDASPPASDDIHEWQIADQAPNLDERVIRAEQTALIQQALLKLSPEHRAVFILHHLEDMSVEDIGSLLQVPAGTIKSRLARARAELRRLLDEYVRG